VKGGEMKKLSITALALVLLLPIVSCGWKLQCTKYTTYNLGEEKIVNVGSEMVQEGCFATRWDPTGLNQSLFKRSSFNNSYFEPYINRELRYA
jgi:hypothetical protein